MKNTATRTARCRVSVPTDVRALHEALTPYIDLPTLRRCAAQGDDLSSMFHHDEQPEEIRALITTLATLLRPTSREQIKGPADVAALLMLEMAQLDQEELRVVALDTKNRIQRITTLYKGSVDSAIIRVGEVYKDAIRLNSVGIIVAHNHPSGEPTPSPEDILITRRIIDAGQLLDISCLDHIVIGQGQWVSLRERGLAFSK